MMDRDQLRACPDCADGVSRRKFLTVSAAAASAATVASVPKFGWSAPNKNSPAETAVKQLYETLSDEQRKLIALPYDDARRTRVSANWSITPANIGSFSKSQQELIHKIIKGITSDDGYGRFTRQMQEDWGAVEKYAIAIFGDPNGEPFQFALTGRHLTLRADGNTQPGSAFGGPIVYGHSKRGNSEKNLFSYQTRRANELFEALDSDQREAALLEKAPRESAVQLRKDTSTVPGVAGGKLSGDQQELLGHVLQDIMAPYRAEDVSEVMKIVESGGGLDAVRMAFYRSGDLDNDEVWDVWRLEGPTIVCHFRGAPHVHAYINVAERS